jgi:hypothetical protein
MVAALLKVTMKIILHKLLGGSLTFLKYVGTDRSFILIFFKYPESAMLATDVC